MTCNNSSKVESQHPTNPIKCGCKFARFFENISARIQYFHMNFPNSSYLVFDVDIHASNMKNCRNVFIFTCDKNIFA